MAANYICIKQKTKVYVKRSWAMVLILGIWVEHEELKRNKCLHLANFHLHNLEA